MVKSLQKVVNDSCGEHCIMIVLPLHILMSHLSILIIIVTRLTLRTIKLWSMVISKNQFLCLFVNQILSPPHQNNNGCGVL